MADGQDIRPQRESRTELFAAMGVLALLPPYYYLLLAINLPDGLAQVVVSAAGPIVLIMIRFFVVRHRAADREIREAVAGGPAINPVFACVATAASILFLESIIGATFGAVVGFTN